MCHHFLHGVDINGLGEAEERRAENDASDPLILQVMLVKDKVVLRSQAAHAMTKDKQWQVGPHLSQERCDLAVHSLHSEPGYALTCTEPKALEVNQLDDKAV